MVYCVTVMECSSTGGGRYTVLVFGDCQQRYRVLQCALQILTCFYAHDGLTSANSCTIYQIYNFTFVLLLLDF